MICNRCFLDKEDNNKKACEKCLLYNKTWSFNNRESKLNSLRKWRMKRKNNVGRWNLIFNSLMINNLIYKIKRLALIYNNEQMKKYINNQLNAINLLN